MRLEDGIDLPAEDFRRLRRYLAPWLLASPDDGTVHYEPPTDLISEDAWDEVTMLSTDVALKSTSSVGSAISRLTALQTNWVFSRPEAAADAPFIWEVTLLASDEFNAVVFNATHGYYRQAIGCLRNALETLSVGAALSVNHDGDQPFNDWRSGAREITFGQARTWLRDSSVGTFIDMDAKPGSVFGDSDTAWMKSLYARLCTYAHSRAGYNNADFWEGNGPIFKREALAVVEAEFRETIGLCYLLLRAGWPGYASSVGPVSLLAGRTQSWEGYVPVLRKWLMPDSA